MLTWGGGLQTAHLLGLGEEDWMRLTTFSSQHCHQAQASGLHEALLHEATQLQLGHLLCKHLLYTAVP